MAVTRKYRISKKKYKIPKKYNTRKNKHLKIKKIKTRKYQYGGGVSYRKLLFNAVAPKKTIDDEKSFGSWSTRINNIILEKIKGYLEEKIGIKSSFDSLDLCDQYEIMKVIKLLQDYVKYKKDYFENKIEKSGKMITKDNQIINHIETHMEYAHEAIQDGEDTLTSVTKDVKDMIKNKVVHKLEHTLSEKDNTLLNKINGFITINGQDSDLKTLSELVNKITTHTASDKDLDVYCKLNGYDKEVSNIIKKSYKEGHKTLKARVIGGGLFDKSSKIIKKIKGIRKIHYKYIISLIYLLFCIILIIPVGVASLGGVTFIGIKGKKIFNGIYDTIEKKVNETYDRLNKNKQKGEQIKKMIEDKIH